LSALFIPIKYKLNAGLLVPECERWNQLAREWQASGFSNTFFKASACSTRRLDGSSSGNTTTRVLLVTQGELLKIYSDKFAPLKKIKDSLAVFGDVEQTIKTVWIGGIQQAVVVLGEVIELYQDIMSTLGSVIQAVLGPVIDVLGVVIDKVGLHI